MAEPDLKEEEQPVEEGPTPNILPGCIIITIVAAVFLSLGTCVVVTGNKMDEELGKFTFDEAEELTIHEPTADQRVTLQEKLDALTEAARLQVETEIRFSIEELNHLIATQDLLESSRGHAEVRAIDSSRMVIRQSWPMRKLGGGPRFLNANFHFVPRHVTSGWQFQLVDVRVPGKPVPEGFIERWADLHMFRFDQKNKELQGVLEQIAEIRLQSGGLTVRTWEGVGKDLWIDFHKELREQHEDR